MILREMADLQVSAMRDLLAGGGRVLAIIAVATISVLIVRECSSPAWVVCRMGA